MTLEAGAIADRPQVAQLAEKCGNAILVRRWLGAWIDLGLAALCIYAADKVLGNDLYQKTIAIWLSLPLLYFVLGEWLWGRTLGKLITGTMVVNVRGERPNLGQVVVRTLFRIVEVNPALLGGVPAGIVVLATPSKQRLGDIFAKTYVLRVRDLYQVRAG